LRLCEVQVEQTEAVKVGRIHHEAQMITESGIEVLPGDVVQIADSYAETMKYQDEERAAYRKQYNALLKSYEDFLNKLQEDLKPSAHKPAPTGGTR